MKRLFLLSALFLLPFVTRLDADESGWPQEMVQSGYRVLVYQPQVERLTENEIEARAAVSVTGPESEEPVFGAVWIEARVMIDRNDRLVRFRDGRVSKVRFPESTEEDQKKLAEFLEAQMPLWNLEIDLDLLIPMLEAADHAAPESSGLKHDPPKILIRSEPTTLIVLDGEPRMQKMEEPKEAAKAKLERVVNTPAAIIFHPGEKRFYLAAGGELWYEAQEALGPYREAAEVPKVVASLIEKTEEDEEGEGDKGDELEGKVPAILVATEPTEIIVISGEPELAALGEVDLLTVTNADREVLVDMASRDHYVLLSGRWYQSPGGLEGPWSFVEPAALPDSFPDIPADSDRGEVRSHIPGTVEAQEALLDTTIPQTSAIKRDDHSFEAEYDGKPKFEPVEGQDLTYAVNTPNSVFKVGKRYYACDEGVWYESSSPTGKWSVATEVPDALYDIPPSNPHHNVTYVKVYDVTPEVVYVGYTPGYLGSYAYGGSVVYGTGWYYPGWYGSRYYPRHSTWGFHATFNPWYGWGFGIGWSSGPLTISIGRGGRGWGHSAWWGPVGWRPFYPPFYRPPFPGYRPPYYPGYRPPLHRPPHHRPPGARPPIARPPGGGGRPGTPANLPSRARPGTPQTRDNNLYARDRNANRSAGRPATMDRTRTTPSTRPNNVLTDRSGNVFKKDSGGSWREREGGSWKPSTGAGETRPSTRPSTTPSTRPSTRPSATPSTRPSTRPSTSQRGSSINRDYSARSRGATRSQQYRSAPSARPSSRPSSRPSGASSRGGGRRR